MGERIDLQHAMKINPEEKYQDLPESNHHQQHRAALKQMLLGDVMHILIAPVDEYSAVFSRRLCHVLYPKVIHQGNKLFMFD